MCLIFVLLNYSKFPQMVLPFHVSRPLYLLFPPWRKLSSILQFRKSFLDTWKGKTVWDILSLTCLLSIRMELLYHFLSSFKHMLICVSFLSCWTTQSFPKWFCLFMCPGLCICCSLCGESCHPSFSSESLSWSFTNALTCHSVFMFLSSLPDFKICTPFTLTYPAPNTRCSESLARKQLDGWVSGWMDGEMNRWTLSTVRPNRVLTVTMGIPLEHRQVRWSPQTEMKETADVRKFLC